MPSNLDISLFSCFTHLVNVSSLPYAFSGIWVLPWHHMHWYRFKVIWCFFWIRYWLSLLSYSEFKVYVLLTGYGNTCWKRNIIVLHRLVSLNYMGYARFVYKLSKERRYGFPNADWYQKNSAMLLLCCGIWFGYDIGWFIVFDEKWKWKTMNMQITPYLCFVILA